MTRLAGQEVGTRHPPGAGIFESRGKDSRRPGERRSCRLSRWPSRWRRSGSRAAARPREHPVGRERARLRRKQRYVWRWRRGRRERQHRWRRVESSVRRMPPAAARAAPSCATRTPRVSSWARPCVWCSRATASAASPARTAPTRTRASAARPPTGASSDGRQRIASTTPTAPPARTSERSTPAWAFARARATPIARAAFAAPWHRHAATRSSASSTSRTRCPGATGRRSTAR
jgi:hypothetical protein